MIYVVFVNWALFFLDITQQNATKDVSLVKIHDLNLYALFIQ